MLYSNRKRATASKLGVDKGWLGNRQDYCEEEV
jgi:hypothetical protein